MITSHFLQEVGDGFDGCRTVHADLITTDHEFFTVRVTGGVEATETEVMGELCRVLGREGGIMEEETIKEGTITVGLSARK